MGQYWIPANLDKREFISPHKLGCGLKLVEQLWNRGVGEALVLLQTMPAAVGRGGGDFETDPVIGRWAGDRVMLVSDYTENNDTYPNPKPGDTPIGEVYGLCDSFSDHWDTPENWAERVEKAKQFGGMFTDISDLVAAKIEAECNVIFIGDGWRIRAERGAIKHAGYDLDDPDIMARVRKLGHMEMRKITDAYEEFLRAGPG